CRNHATGAATASSHLASGAVRGVASVDHQRLPGGSGGRSPAPGATAHPESQAFGVSTVLAVEAVTKHFYGVAALSEISFEVEQGELLSIIGPNGSGKTTLFNIITGFLRADRGRVRLHGNDIS